MPEIRKAHVPLARLALCAALVLAVLAALVPRAAQAATHIQRARSGALSASYSYSGRFPNYRSGTLTIRDGRRIVYRHPVRMKTCGRFCVPGSTVAGTSSLRFVRLAAGAPVTLVLELYSGGAHCCTLVQLTAARASGGSGSGGGGGGGGKAGSGSWGVLADHNFGDPGYKLVDLRHNGAYEFLTADDRFAYAFTSFAASGMPLEILAFADGRFSNVTRRYPQLIASDARVWMSAFVHQRHSNFSDTTGVVAAWAADELELGHSARVHAFLTREARAKHLNSSLGHDVPQGEAYVHALLRFLERTGYAAALP